ncbi:MAG: DUF3617 family protein [Wenzhouxiangellaceae bacterium]|nr:DUF3617 family protein [Wenzhouxiangellaceae bacterium]
MKLQHLLAGVAGLAVGFSAMAEQPNIEPGMWETTSNLSIESEQFPIPPRSDTSSSCVTAEEIAEGQAFLDDNEECDFTRKDIRADGMDYSMTCETPDGGRTQMDASMKFNGDSMSGLITGDIESPMGVMKMKIELNGRRIGDC